MTDAINARVCRRGRGCEPQEAQPTEDVRLAAQLIEAANFGILMAEIGQEVARELW